MSVIDHTRPYVASLTREPFLFYEMRTTAKLLSDGADEKETIARIAADNLFQYPTEKSVARMAKACVYRLYAMGDNDLVKAIAAQPAEIAKQICLYPPPPPPPLVWEFMVTVIGEKYRLKDQSFGKIDLNAYFMRLQEQDDTVASWSDKTITKQKQVLAKILVETEYLDDIHAEYLNPVYLYPILENAIRSKGDLSALPAFNCFS